MTKRGYARVSTTAQSTRGNSLDAQRDALLAAGCTDVTAEHVTGTTIDRPALNRLVADLAPGDVLVVTKLDRLARTAVEGCTLVRSLLSRGIGVHVLNMGLIDDTPMGRMMVTMLLAFAEFEHDLILERTAEGKARARMRPDYREGRPRLAIDTEAMEEARRAVAAKEMTVKEACARLNMSRSTWYARAAEHKSAPAM